MIVQIVKEPISTKGSRLTAEISLAGRNIVLIPFAEKVSISQKISSKEEKRRLETLVRSILLRTTEPSSARRPKARTPRSCVAELKSLLRNGSLPGRKWPSQRASSCSSPSTARPPPSSEISLNDSFSNIHVNNEAVYEEIKKYISLISPDRGKDCEAVQREGSDLRPLRGHKADRKLIRQGGADEAGSLSGHRDDRGPQRDRCEQRHPLRRPTTRRRTPSRSTRSLPRRSHDKLRARGTWEES